MFEFSSTYSANPSAAFSSGSMLVSSASSSFSASSRLGSSFRSSVGTAVAPISVRTSDKTLRSFFSGGGIRSYTYSGCGSFISIHNEVQSGMSEPGNDGGISSVGMVYGGKPGGKPEDPPIGQKDPLVPVGDALIPMLLMIAVYAIIRIFHNRKKLQTINQSVNK